MDNFDQRIKETQGTDKKDFESGASTSGDLPPYECLTPTFLKRAALRMKLGLHYGKHNWKKGINDKAFILDRLNHAIEHLIKAQQEIDSDQVMGDDDLAAVVVNCMFAMEYQDRVLIFKNHFKGMSTEHIREMDRMEDKIQAGQLKRTSLGSTSPSQPEQSFPVQIFDMCAKLSAGEMRDLADWLKRFANDKDSEKQGKS